jgi:pimeloyl-ACP methyl ester carboxylesterase
MGVIVVLVSLLALGALYQRRAAARHARDFPPPGTLIDVGGRGLHVICEGHGEPMVLLESGVAASSLSWAYVQPEIARFTRVCAYDRAGLAWSDPPGSPRTLPNIIADLHEVLGSAASQGAIVMVGHSFGCFVVCSYAARHPDRVAGLVLLDPPTQWLRPTARRARMLRGGIQLSRLGGLLAQLGVVRACLALLRSGRPGAPRALVKIFGPTAASTLERLVGEVQKLPAEVHPMIMAHWCQPRCFRAMADHLQALQATDPDIVSTWPIREIPLCVISAGNKGDEQLEQHRTLAAMSSQGRHLVADGSGHWIQFDRPDLVISAVREVMAIARDVGRRAGNLPAPPTV